MAFSALTVNIVLLKVKTHTSFGKVYPVYLLSGYLGLESYKKHPWVGCFSSVSEPIRVGDMSHLYSLEEAAAKLNMSVDALREMAKKRTIRSFQDKGTLRFKSEDIEAILSKPKEDLPSDSDEFQLDLPPTPQSSIPAETPEPLDAPLNLDLDLGSEDFTLPMDDAPSTPAPSNDPSTSSGEIINLQGDSLDSNLEFSLDLPESESNASDQSSPLITPPTESPFELSEPVIDLGSDTIGLMGDSSDSSSSSNHPTMGEIDLEKHGELPLNDSMVTSQGASSSIEIQHPEIEESSEFELSIDESGSVISGADSQLDIGSGTELSTDESGSEFELTMEDGVENSSEVDLSEGSDLESSDFELEASESDSGSQIVDMENADADPMEQTAEFATGDDLEVVDDNSSSQVVAVEEIEEVQEEVEEITEVEEEEEVPTSAPAYAATETPWGILPALVLIPGVLILAVVCLISFELMRGLYGYNKGTGFTSVILKPIAEMFTELPK